MPGSSVVKLAIAGAVYEGWYALDMDSDIFTPADAFTVTAKIPDDPEFMDVMREGVSVDIYVGDDDDRQMTGVIDAVNIDSSNERAAITIEGRDKGAYLTDCEAKHFKASKYTLKSLIEALIRPEWGIRNVIVSNEDNRKLLLGRKDKKSTAGKGKAGLFGDLPRAVTKIDPGTRIATVLDERTRQLGVTWWMTAQGDLFIGKPTYDQVPSYDFRSYKHGSKQAASNNCAIRVRRALDGRYSKITMNGQGMSTTGNIFDGTSSAAKRGKKLTTSAVDPDLVARGIERETIVSDHDTLTTAELQKHVDFDMGNRRLNALRIYVSYPGLRFEENDRLFAVDTIAYVRFEEARIDGQYYVCQRRNFKDARQERTELTLIEPGVWLP